MSTCSEEDASFRGSGNPVAGAAGSALGPLALGAGLGALGLYLWSRRKKGAK